jgi:DNA-binding NarL/FixJ family response regulator
MAALTCAAATGGELLVSALAKQLTEDDAPDLSFGASLELELKGLPGLHMVHRVGRVDASGRHEIRLVIADDALIVRDGLAALLRAGGLTVHDVTDTADGLLTLFERHRPDVVITDVRMPPTHTDEGLVAAERIRAMSPTTGILVLSQHPDPALAVRLLATSSRAGTGYLLKDHVTDLDLLIEAVRRVHCGGAVLDAELVDRMIRRRTRQLADLSERQRELLPLVTQGLTDEMIAARVGNTEAQARGDVGTLLSTLGLEPALTGTERVAALVDYLAQR